MARRADPRRDELLGALAVASYEPQAFNESDMALLMTIAGQAATGPGQRRAPCAGGGAGEDRLTDRGLQPRIPDPSSGGRGGRLAQRDATPSRSSCWTSTGSRSTTTPTVTSSATMRCALAVRRFAPISRGQTRWADGAARNLASCCRALGHMRPRKVAERVRETLAALDLRGASGSACRTRPSVRVSRRAPTMPACGPTGGLADRALYKAKERGRDQVEVAAPEPQRVPASVSTENDRGPQTPRRSA